MALALCLSAYILNPTPASAIPSAGDYVFTSGLTGTFTSSGTQLTSWNFTDPINDIPWLSAFSPLSNNETSFFNEIFATLIGGGLPGTFLNSSILINWVTNEFRATLQTDRFSPPIDAATEGPFSFRLDSGAGNPVPEPSTVGLLTIGLLGLLAYEWRRTRLRVD